MNWFKKKSPPIRSLIGEGTVVMGHVNFTEGLRIDGEVLGDVTGPDEGTTLLVVSEKAKVHGMVKAGHVIINGEVLGPIESQTLLELQPRARVVGNIRYELLEMHPGALIDGELRPLKQTDRPALKLAASNGN
jgi:cytoskeletal protein CcmA (bactofilin family)